MKPNRYFYAVTLWFGCSVTVSVMAENASPLLGLSLEQLMQVPIVTASRFAEKITDTPTTVIVVTRQQIQNRRYINLIDLLQDLPGVDVQRGVEDVRYHNITIRGHQGNNRFLILQDGVRIDSPTGELIPVAENFPLYHAHQVEILYGPAAAIYGADAFGGVINIITQDAIQVDGVHLSTGFGTDNYRYTYAHAGKVITDNVELVVGAHTHHSDTANLAEAYPDAYAPANATTLDGTVVVPAAERESFIAPIDSHTAFAKLVLAKSLTLGVNHSFFHSLTSVGVRPATTLYSEQAQWSTTLNTVYLSYERALASNWYSKTRLEYAAFEVDPLSRFNNIFTNFNAGYKYSEGQKHSIEQQFSYEINTAHRISSGFSIEDFYSLPRTADVLPICQRLIIRA